MVFLGQIITSMAVETPLARTVLQYIGMGLATVTVFAVHVI